MESPYVERNRKRGGRGGKQKFLSKGLANIYKLNRTHLAVRMPASANYYSDKHHVFTMLNTEESGS